MGRIKIGKLLDHEDDDGNENLESWDLLVILVQV